MKHPLNISEITKIPKKKKKKLEKGRYYNTFFAKRLGRAIQK